MQASSLRFSSFNQLVNAMQTEKTMDTLELSQSQEVGTCILRTRVVRIGTTLIER